MHAASGGQPEERATVAHNQTAAHLRHQVLQLLLHLWCQLKLRHVVQRSEHERVHEADEEQPLPASVKSDAEMRERKEARGRSACVAALRRSPCPSGQTDGTAAGTTHHGEKHDHAERVEASEHVVERALRHAVPQLAQDARSFVGRRVALTRRSILQVEAGHVFRLFSGRHSPQTSLPPVVSTLPLPSSACAAGEGTRRR